MSGQSSTPLRGRPIIKAFYDEPTGSVQQRSIRTWNCFLQFGSSDSSAHFHRNHAFYAVRKQLVIYLRPADIRLKQPTPETSPSQGC